MIKKEVRINPRASRDPQIQPVLQSFTAAQKLIPWKILRGDNNVMIIRVKDKGDTGLVKHVIRTQNLVITKGKILINIARDSKVMARPPCTERMGVARKGPWTPEEDIILVIKFTKTPRRTMSMKRSRQSESNFIEKDVLNHMSSPGESAREVCGSSSGVMKPPPKCLKPTLEEVKEVKSWLNVASVPPSCGSLNGGIGNLLKYCHFCTKKIDQDKDLFMYRDLGAFCTQECRALQMELDNRQERYENANKPVAQDKDGNSMFH